MQFLLSDGATLVLREPAVYWEVPIAGPLPENFASNP